MNHREKVRIPEAISGVALNLASGGRLVPEGLNDGSQIGSAWDVQKKRPVAAGRYDSVAQRYADIWSGAYA